MTAQHMIILPAPPEEVFAALTEPERITQWWGEDSVYWMTNVQHELRPGGAANYRGTFTNNDNVSGSSAGREFLGAGVTRAVDAPRMLEYTRRYADGIPHNGGTRLTVTHTGFETEEISALHKHGWERAFGWLEAFLRTGSVTLHT